MGILSLVHLPLSTRFTFFCLSLQCFCNPSAPSSVLLWTFSKFFSIFLNCGHQACTHYSSVACTNAQLRKGNKTSLLLPDIPLYTHSRIVHIIEWPVLINNAHSLQSSPVIIWCFSPSLFMKNIIWLRTKNQSQGNASTWWWLPVYNNVFETNKLASF